MGRKFFGLDIRTDAVSAVLVDNSIKGNVIEAHMHIPITADLEGNGSSFSDALETITKEMNIADAVSVVSFPAEQVSYRNIRVPFKEAKKIKQVLPFELEPILPFPVDDLAIDFNTLALSEQGEGAGILAAAVEKGELAAFKAHLTEHQIEPQSVAVGGYQTVLCLSHLSTIPDHALFVDIDVRKSTLFAVLSGQVHLVRSLPFRSSLNMTPEMLSTRIKQTISASGEMLGPDFEPKVIFVTGQGLKAYEYESYMSDFFELPIKKINLVQDADISMLEPPDPSWVPELMDSAFALAISEIVGIDGLNLSKRQFAAKKYWMAHKSHIIRSGILLGVVLFLALVNVIFDYYSMQRQENELDTQIENIFKSAFPESRVVDPLRQMQANIREVKAQAAGPGEVEKHARVIDVLNDISTFIPKQLDVTLSRFVIGPDNVQISGDTDTFNAVDDIKSKLEQGKLFKKITISSTSKDKTENRINFKLKIDL